MIPYRTATSRHDHAIPAPVLDRSAVRWLANRLQAVRGGRIEIVGRSGVRLRVGDTGPQVRFQVRSWSLLWRLAVSGDLGFAESYMQREWETDDLSTLLWILATNRDRLAAAQPGRLRRAAARLFHGRHANTLRGSRRNIRDHYDLGDELFETFLDPSMTYSCAMFEPGIQSLGEAQARKLDRMIELADLRPGQRVLEIGCGWGSFALRAATRTDCHITCLTLSERQRERVQRRVTEQGLGDRIEVKLLDYRHARGRYDRIVSIEMLEAVGREYLGSFFRICEELLEPGGRLALQVITIADELYEDYSCGTDFIQRHIFPGGHLPSRGRLLEAIDSHTEMTPQRVAPIGHHYARTLVEWRERFGARNDRLRVIGYSEAFLRKWLYYFAYCEAGFRDGSLDVLQMALDRPRLALARPRTCA